MRRACSKSGRDTFVHSLFMKDAVQYGFVRSRHFVLLLVAARENLGACSVRPFVLSSSHVGERELGKGLWALMAHTTPCQHEYCLESSSTPSLAVAYMQTGRFLFVSVSCSAGGKCFTSREEIMSEEEDSCAYPDNHLLSIALSFSYCRDHKSFH